MATKNLGQRFGLLVGSALLVDYILTVAVSTASGVENIGSAIKFVGDHKVAFSVGIIVLVTAANLRGLKEAGAAFAIPVYLFIVASSPCWSPVWSGFCSATRCWPRPPSYGSPGVTQGSDFALVFLLLRAFSSGSAALTGVEAISNGVPAFRKPKARTRPPRC